MVEKCPTNQYLSTIQKAQSKLLAVVESEKILWYAFSRRNADKKKQKPRSFALLETLQPLLPRVSAIYMGHSQSSITSGTL
jgi:hypothetical protein